MTKYWPQCGRLTKIPMDLVGDGIADDTEALNNFTKSLARNGLVGQLPPAQNFYRTTGPVYFGGQGSGKPGATLLAWGAKVIKTDGLGPTLFVTRFDLDADEWIIGDNPTNDYSNIQGGTFVQKTPGQDIILLRGVRKSNIYFEQLSGPGRSTVGSRGIRLEAVYKENDVEYKYGSAYYNKIGWGQLISCDKGLSVQGSVNGDTFNLGNIQCINTGIEILGNQLTVNVPTGLTFLGGYMEDIQTDGKGMHITSCGAGLTFYGLTMEPGHIITTILANERETIKPQFFGCKFFGKGQMAVTEQAGFYGCYVSSWGGVVTKYPPNPVV